MGNLARLQPFTVDTTYVTLLCDSEEPFLQLIVTFVSALKNLQELFIENRSTEWNYWLLIGYIRSFNTVDMTYVTLPCDSEEPFLQLIVTVVSALQNLQELFIKN